MTKTVYPELNHQVFTHAVRLVRDAYLANGHSLWDIGNGLCENFAYEVLDIVIGDGWQTLEGQDGRDWLQTATECMFAAPLDGDDYQCEAWNWDLLEQTYNITVPEHDRARYDALVLQNPSHCWVYFAGRHYDCEHPDGVESFFDLNFFRRYLGMDDLADPA